MKFLATIGRAVLAFLAAIGSVTLFAVETVSHLFRPPYYPREFAHALLQIGYLKWIWNLARNCAQDDESAVVFVQRCAKSAWC